MAPDRDRLQYRRCRRAPRSLSSCATGQFNVEQAVAEVQRAADEYLKTLKK